MKSKASAQSEASERLRPPGVSPAAPDYEDHSAVCENRVGAAAAACASVCMCEGGGRERERDCVSRTCLRATPIYIYIRFTKGCFFFCCFFFLPAMRLGQKKKMQGAEHLHISSLTRKLRFHLK